MKFPPMEEDLPVANNPTDEVEVDQDAERSWVLDDGTGECYDIVARPSYIKEALYAAKGNLGWTSFYDADGDQIFININKLIAIAPAIQE